MKLNLIERLIVNNPLRAFIQRHVEGPLLRKMGTLKKYPLCLEIGCGRGTGTEAIVRQFGARNVIATDMDPRQIDKAKNTISPALKDKVEFKVADVMALDEPSERFDAVFSFGVIHHTEDWRKAVKEVSRVLKSNGEFFFEEALRPFLRNFLVRIFTAHPEGGEFDFSELVDELKKNNIDIIDKRLIRNIAVFGVGRKR